MTSNARHIGRVGALAVTLGVGVAMATTPGAYADPSGSSSPTGDSSSTSTGAGASGSTAAVGGGTASADGDGVDLSPSDLKSALGSADGFTLDSDMPAGDDIGDDAADAEEDAENGGGAEELIIEGDADTLPASSDEDTALADALSAQDDDSLPDSLSGDSADQQVWSRSASAEGVTFPDTSGGGESSVAATGQPTRLGGKQSQIVGFAGVADSSARYSFEPASAEAFTAVSTPAEPPPAVPQQPPTLLSAVSNLVAAVLQPLLSWGTGSPVQTPLLWGMLAAVRGEFERMVLGRNADVAPQQTISQLADPTDQHVLVIGIDGTNLSRVLADPTNENFFELMDTATSSAPSIVGHTTISNPSWTAILTGAWGEKTGVINNVFTPWTYDRWPTVFNQLETFNPDIQTKAIADWDVNAAIAGAGSHPADEVVFIPQIAGDTNFSQTDAAVTAETVKSIEGAEDVPNFLFTYLAQVDENGHMFGGASEEYKQAIQRTDDNLGLILDAVEERRKCSPGPCEDWTVIVTTDHGHQPQLGFGHGFQSPDETETFVIVDGPAFGDGLINTDYEIVGVTPTVVSLFGASQASGLDGVPLMTLGPGIDPGDQEDLHAALQAQIAENQPPDAITNLALSARTIFATIPYLVHGLQIPIIGDLLYVATNVPAQIVAFLTGVQGANIFPLLPPPPASSFIPDQETTTVLVNRQDCNDASLDAEACIAS